MAIVFLPLNGIGMGHLSRSFALARQLRELGEKPVIFAQGKYPQFMADDVPGFRLGAIYKAWWPVRWKMAADIATYARRTSPAVVVDDTHPAKIRLGSDICRVLALRPTTMNYLRWLRLRHEHKFRQIFVADHPDSPTWPFSDVQSREISTWEKWTCVGPIFRRATAEGRRRVREKYSLHDGEPHFVFTMGGGGSQKTDGLEVPAFVARAASWAEMIRAQIPAARLLFVRGPLFPKTQSLPDIFQDIATEDDMPSLIAEASGAVIRPGFNTLWECIGGQTPFVCIEGDTYREPVADRDRRLRAAKLVPNDFDHWLDPAFIERFKQACPPIAARWPVLHAAECIQKSLAKIAPKPGAQRTIAPTEPGKIIPAVHSQTSGRKGLVIRVDDVVEGDAEMVSLRRLCVARGLSVSLEMIPYLCKFDEGSLKAFAGDWKYEVSQHGYDHLPRRDAGGLKAEFLTDEDCQPSLSRGIQIMRQKFRETFRGGFSAPFDAYPPALSSTWQALGGKYVSVVWSKMETHLPKVQLTVDPWNWPRNSPRSLAWVMKQIAAAIKDRDYIGLCLHAQLLKFPGQIEYHERLFDQVLNLGVEPVMLSEVALRLAKR
jgi:UDP:flavonoid glycosyltransferase YjiC (YdhE family)